MSTIKDVSAREILDSRGDPTIICDVTLEDGTVGTGSVPSGAAKSKAEAFELRDNDPKRYSGKGVQTAVNNVNTVLKAAIVGMEADLQSVDAKMIATDGTPNKSKIGANAILSVSLATAKAAAISQKVQLYQYFGQLLGKADDNLTMPLPFLNILNGGKHAVGSTDFQEFMIVPVKFATFAESIRAGSEIFHALAGILNSRNYQPLVGDEGGFAPAIFSNEQAMELLTLAITEADYTPGEDVYIALDPAASRFYSDGYYELHRENKALLTKEMVDFYENWCDKYPIISIEDPLDQSDWNGWKDLAQRIGDRVEIIGDDIFSTNQQLLQKGISERAATGILIKINQAGTVTEAINTIKMAQSAGYRVIISHRSGETEDTAIADLAVACGCGAIKAGAPCRSERTAKYNRLLEIEAKNTGKTSLATWN